MTNTDTLQAWLSEPKAVAIICHERPDGDAIGSSLGLAHYLSGMGHQVKVIAPTDYPDFLKWIPGNSRVLIGPLHENEARESLEKAELIFCLDFNDPRRAGDFEDTLLKSKAKKILVDHHIDPVDFTDLQFWDEKASSTAELVYRIMEGMGNGHKVTVSIAHALYVGIMTDTGSFRYSNTTAEVHRIVSKLVEKGVNVPIVHERLYDTASENRLRFIGHVLSQCLTVLPEYHTAYILADKSTIHNFDLKSGDTEGLVNYTLSLKGIRFGVLITEQQGLVKMSFRSKGNFAANEFAAYFNGGGHFHAAGGRSTEPIREVEKRFIHLLELNKQKLIP